MYFNLGEITDAQAVQQAIGVPGQSGAPSSSLVQQQALEALRRGAVWLVPGKPKCSGSVGSTGAKITNIAGSAAGTAATVLKFAGVTGPAAPILLVAGAALSVFGAIFSHHAAAMAKESNILCAAVPAFNDAFNAIDQAVRTKQITPQVGMSSLDQLYLDMQATVQPVLKNDSSHCNAACFVLAMARALIMKRKSQYADIKPPAPPVAVLPATPAAAIQSAGSVVNKVASQTRLPAWAIWSIGGLAAARIFGVL